MEVRLLNKRLFWWIVVIIFGIAFYRFTASPLSNDAHTIKFLERLSSLSAQDVNFLSKIIRKLAHLLAFGVIAIAFKNALSPHRWNYPAAWLLATLFGASDEIHQIFVPGRTPLFSDVMIDSIGALLTLYALYRLTLRKEKS
jgi:VanZ family protein